MSKTILLHDTEFQWNGKTWGPGRPRTWEPYNGKLAYAKGSKTVQEVTPTGPWSPQQPYIDQLFSEAQNLYQQGSPQYYQGSTVAAPNANLVGSQNATVDYLNSQVPVNQMMQGATQGFMGGAYNSPTAQLGQQATGAVGQGIGQLLTGQYNPIAQQGQAGAMDALGRVFNSGPQQISAPNIMSPIQAPRIQYAPQVQGMQVNTQQVNTPQIGAAQVDAQGAMSQALQGGASNPYLDQLVQAATRSATRQFNDSVLPGIRTDATLAGQRGGASEGLAQGIAAGRMGETIGDVTSQLYGNAFNQNAETQRQALGLATGAQTNQAQLAGQIGQSNAQLGLAGQELQGNLMQNAQGQNASNFLNAQQLAGSLGMQAQQLRANQMAQQGQLGLQAQMGNASVADQYMQRLLQGTGLVSQATLGQNQLNQQGLIAGTQVANNAAQYGNSSSMDQFLQGLQATTGLQGNQVNQFGTINTVGQQQQQLQQAQLDDLVNRWFFNQYAPYNALSQYQSYISGNYGSSVPGKP
ncbi:MAG: hypothetical protein E6R03_03040 [Hyphomicrobiaceae bacterium]|nr:MAG: hypothetical protein E6R03_03040 [Hyphomicrobiaceae bacterium]